MRSTDSDWESWANIDPYYAVVTYRQFRKDQISDYLSDFFQTGETEIGLTLETAAKYFGALNFGRALDFGSGVGRLAIPLARRFQEVVGVEISKTMIANAEANCEKHNVSNVSFVPSDDGLTHVQGKFDFINSYIVLQHIERARGMKIVERLLGAVAPGGKVMLHVSLDRNQSLAKKSVYWLKFNVPGANAMFNLARRVPFKEPPMRMTQYDLKELLRLFVTLGFPHCMVELEVHSSADEGAATRGVVTTAKLFSAKPA